MIFENSKRNKENSIIQIGQSGFDLYASLDVAIKSLYEKVGIEA